MPFTNAEDVKNLLKDQKDLTLEDVKYLFKKIDRSLKTVTTDSEISGEINIKTTPDELLPLSMEGLDKDTNLLGGMSVSRFISLMDKSWEEDSLQKNKRYSRFKKAMEQPEIEGILNIYADEAFTENHDGEVLIVRHPDEEIRNIVKEMFERIGIYEKGWDIIRNMCGYGDEYYEVVISQNTKRILKLTWIPRDFIKRNETNGTLMGFEIDEDNLKGSSEGNLYQSFGLEYRTNNEKIKELIHPFRILHFKIPSKKYGVYGRSILDAVITSIEGMQMMERAMMVARITRAAERRIYTVDVGTLQGDKAIAYAKKAVSGMHSMRKISNFLNQNSIDFQRDIFSATEDVVIPKRANTEGNSIDTLPQANGLDQIGDLEYMRDKIFPGVGVLRQYLFDDTFTNSNINLSSKSVPFSKRVKRIQRFFLYQMYKLATIELKLKKCSNEQIEALEILMNNPSNIDEQQRLELETARWTLISTIKGMNAEGAAFYPDYKIYSEYLKLNDNEIVELLKLIYLQNANQNPFDAFDPEDRPEGADELLVGEVGPPEGNENPENPLGSEEVNAMGGEAGVPAEVTNALANPESVTAGETAPAPEEAVVASYEEPTKETTDYLEEKKIKLLDKKNKILNKFSQIQEYVESMSQDAKQEKQKYIKVNALLEEQSINGEFKGLKILEKGWEVYNENDE